MDDTEIKEQVKSNKWTLLSSNLHEIDTFNTSCVRDYNSNTDCPQVLIVTMSSYKYN